jgi:hypothetical protein
MTTKGITTSNLIEGIHAGRLSAVISALDDGADIETPDMHGFSGLPLRTACFEGNLPIIRELLNRGANVNAATSDGPGAPLRLALRKGHQEVVALLLQHGAHMPDGLAAALASAPKSVDLEAPTLPESKPDSNIIEFTRDDNILTNDGLDTPSQFGTETNLLSMDLLFLDEHEAHHTSPRPKNGH